MHEVLAPILWVVSRDAIEIGDSIESEADEPSHSELIRKCVDPQYLEHDTFTLFGIIMQTVKSFYEVGNTAQSTLSTTSNTSSIIERSRRVHEVYLRQADSKLADHLATIEILPQIFLIRWIRLLFGREFPFDDVLTVWDVLFAEDPTLDLIDLVCVSMLLRIRWRRKFIANLRSSDRLKSHFSLGCRLLGSFDFTFTIPHPTASQWTTYLRG